MEASLRSNNSIAQLACALAKAQIELVNPPKSLTAHMDGNGNGSSGQSYKYAPLSAGLDIVRKTLGKHEIAVMQTTDMDRDSGLLVLTTTLAHGSGEWIAARWPVCRIQDLADPKAMGAALTYARRYGLFTLVGLAGEDHLDGPELMPDENVRPSTAGPHRKSSRQSQREQANGQHRGRRWKIAPEVRTTPCAERLLEQLGRMTDVDELLRWALAILPLRNRLDEDARGALDAAFAARAEKLKAEPELLLALTPASRP